MSLPEAARQRLVELAAARGIPTEQLEAQVGEVHRTIASTSVMAAVRALELARAEVEQLAARTGSAERRAGAADALEVLDVQLGQIWDALEGFLRKTTHRSS